MPNPNQFTHARQRGAVLIVALVMLLVLTVLGTASIRDTGMEERMAGNFRDHAAALEAAETALRLGESQVATASVFAGMAFDGTDGTYTVTDTSMSVDPEQAGNYGRNVPTSVLSHGGSLLVSEAPKFYVEQLPEQPLQNSDKVEGQSEVVPEVFYYRVTAKGKGVTPNSEAILQSTYFR